MPAPTVCIGIEKDANDTDNVTIGYYKCKASSNKVAATLMPATYSPYSGEFMKIQASADTAQITVGDIRNDKDLFNLGSCPTCQTEHHVMANAKSYFVDEGNDLHCTLCNTEYTPVLANSEFDNLENDDDDDNDDEDLEINSSDDDDEDNDDEDTEDLEINSSDDDDDDDDDDEEDLTNPVNTPSPTVVPTPAPEPASVVASTNVENVVAATTSDFVINCLANAGDLSKKKLNLVSINPGMSLVLADDMPILRLFADKAGDNAKLYQNSKSLATALQAIIASGSDDFSTIGGEPIEYDVQIDSAVENKVKESVTAATAELNQEKETLVEEFEQCLSIANALVTKNIDKTLVNPLREKLIETLSALNIKNAESHVDGALAASGEELMKTVISSALELRKKPLTSRNEIALFAKNANYNKSVVTASSIPVENKTFGEELANNSIIFTTAGVVETPVSANSASDANVNRYRSLLK